MTRSHSATVALPAGMIRSLFEKRKVRPGVVIGVGSLALGAVVWWFWGHPPWGRQAQPQRIPAAAHAAEPGAGHAEPGSATVRMSEEQQRSVGLRTERVSSGTSPRVSTAAGRVAPNENHYAFITPRASGVVRSVSVHLGQEVKAGDLLATVDSPEVGEVRLELFTRLQTLDVARTQASWQEAIFGNTIELLGRLQKGESPEQIHNAFSDRALGENREKLMTAYAQYRLAKATIDRNRDLFAQKLITPKQFEQVKADYEVAQATYQSLMDEMGYEARLANTRAQQAWRQAETAVRAAKERLRILGVKPDGTEPYVQDGKVIGVEPDGTLVNTHEQASASAAGPESILPSRPGAYEVAVKPLGAQLDAGPTSKDAPVSTYSIWAPFDGTILDRELIVPGVAVDTTHRIFTLANLETVWVEASVHESDFAVLDLTRNRGGEIRFQSPAYPDRVFEGEVIYTGDLVEEKSRTVKLLAKAQNPERLLRPGMFVEVEVLSPRTKATVQIPVSALLADGGDSFVFVRSGSDSFERHEVDAEPPRGGAVTVRSGLKDGDEVVVAGGYKLKALAAESVAEDR
jgi:cobalt-zinc-cadmium efflux system membrane fusion protein